VQLCLLAAVGQPPRPQLGLYQPPHASCIHRYCRRPTTGRVCIFGQHRQREVAARAHGVPSIQHSMPHTARIAIARGCYR
jgi:hypothetical protein